MGLTEVLRINCTVYVCCQDLPFRVVFMGYEGVYIYDELDETSNMERADRISKHDHEALISKQ